MNKDQLHGAATALLTTHPMTGAQSGALREILEQCEQRSLNPGALLCKENEPGKDIYFLLRGSVEVLKRDSKGIDRELGHINAPALLGHMSLVDHSARSATCKVKEQAVVASLARKDYTRIYSSTDAQGRTLRRLLIASMADQLSSGNAQLQNIIAPLLKKSDAPTPTSEQTIAEALSPEELTALSGTYQGWAPTED